MLGAGMKRFKLVALAICVAVQMSGRVTTGGSTVSESQSKPRDPRLARMYFLRESGLAAIYGAAAAAEIKIDGKSVGSVVSGTYLFVDRPPGTYKLSSGTPLSMAYETEARVDAGQTYYFGIGVPQVAHPGQNAVNQALAGSGGQQMRATSPLMGGFSAAALYQMDTASGTSAISQLKAQ